MRKLALLLLAIVAPALAQAADRPRLNSAIARLAAGEPALGAFSSVRDPLSALGLARSRLDYVIIDMEHGPWNAETLRVMVSALRGADGRFAVAPLVRIPTDGDEVADNGWIVKQALDAGVFGIVVPHVDSPAEAAAAVAAIRYPQPKDSPAPEPNGRRGWGPGFAAAAWGLEVPDYARRADLWPLNPDGELLLVVLIESRAAIAVAAEILSVPGVGGGFIGPSDLHADMGFLAQTGVPEVEAAIQRALAAAKSVDVAIGITTVPGDIQARLDQGFRLPTLGADTGLSGGIEAALKAAGR